MKRAGRIIGAVDPEADAIPGSVGVREAFPGLFDEGSGIAVSCGEMSQEELSGICPGGGPSCLFRRGMPGFPGPFFEVPEESGIVIEEVHPLDPFREPFRIGGIGAIRVGVRGGWRIGQLFTGDPLPLTVERILAFFESGPFLDRDIVFGEPLLADAAQFGLFPEEEAGAVSPVMEGDAMDFELFVLEDPFHFAPVAGMEAERKAENGPGALHLMVEDIFEGSRGMDMEFLFPPQEMKGRQKSRQPQVMIPVEMGDEDPGDPLELDAVAFEFELSPFPAIQKEIMLLKVEELGGRSPVEAGECGT